MSVHSAGKKYHDYDNTIGSELQLYLEEYKTGIIQSCELLMYIQKSFINENTIAIITSDHGKMLGARGPELAHSKHLYAETLEIPFVFVGSSRKIINTFHTQENITSTIIEATGINSLYAVSVE